VPAERGALDAGGKRVDAGEGRQVADFLGGVAGGDDLVEIFVESCWTSAAVLPLA
jgi:hypothetical protein